MQKGQGDELVVPLVTASAEEPFVLEIRYTLEGRKDAFRCLHSSTKRPRRRSISARSCRPPRMSWARPDRGPRIFEWGWGNQGRWIPINSEPHESRKWSWVCEGNTGALGAAKTFHVDGTPLIFSTLRPDPQTNVRLWTLDHQTLDAWIFGVVLLVGVVLVRTSLARRVIAAAVLVVALVLLGVFWPTLSLHVLGCPLFAAVAIVLLFWAVVGLFRLQSAAHGPVYGG